MTAYEPWGASTYHGLQTQLNRRFSNGLQFQVAYTWSHTIDNSTADFHSTDVSPRRPQDFRNLPAERGNSIIDHANRITIAAIYDAPWYKGSSNWLKKNVLGNYEIAPVYTYESGQWGTVQSAVDSNLNYDSAGDRVIFNPSGTRTPVATLSAWSQRAVHRPVTSSPIKLSIPVLSMSWPNLGRSQPLAAIR